MMPNDTLIAVFVVHWFLHNDAVRHSVFALQFTSHRIVMPIDTRSFSLNSALKISPMTILNISSCSSGFILCNNFFWYWHGIIMRYRVKVVFFTHVPFANDQHKYVKSRHFLVYILTFYLRMIDKIWWKSSFFILTLTYCEQSTQVGKKSTFFTYLHPYMLLVKIVFFTYILSAINRCKLVKGRHFTYLLTCLLMSCISMIDKSR